MLEMYKFFLLLAKNLHQLGVEKMFGRVPPFYKSDEGL